MRKPSNKTLERVISYLDTCIQLPLSIDDAVYLRWRLQADLFNRRVEEMRSALFEEWQAKYTVRFRDGYYEQGQLVKK